MTAIRSLFSVALLVCGASLVVAQEAEKPVQPPPPVAPTPAPANDKLAFEPKFVMGESFYQQITTEVEQTVKVQGGNELKLKHAQTFLFQWTPMKQEGDKWTVRMTIEGIKLKVDVANNPVNYDSTNEQANANNPGLNDFFKNLIGSEFTIVFTKNMMVEKVDGQEALLKSLGAANQQMEQLLKKILTTEALKEMSDPLAGLTPGVAKGVGEKWDRSTPLNLGPIGTYDRKLSFTYKGKDTEQKELERVEVSTTMKYSAPAGDADGLLFRVKAGDLTTQNPKPGYYLYDAKTGLVVKAELAVTMQGTLNVAVGSTETTVQLNQTQKTTVESSKKSFLPEK